MRWVIVAALLGVALSGCTAPEGSDGPDPHAIEAEAMTFVSGDRTIPVGTTVSFVMKVGSHTVDFAEGDAEVPGVSKAHSGNLDPGDTHEVTFTEPGVYPYFCLYHSSRTKDSRTGMIGTITVQ